MKYRNRLFLSLLLCTLGVIPYLAVAEQDESSGRAKGLAALSSLEVLAQKGDNEALYTLGWIYLQPTKVSEPDLDKAFKYLVQVEGELENSSRILIGYIYSIGTNNIESDISKTEITFREASSILKAEFREITELGKKMRSLSEGELKSYMQRSMQAQKDHNILYAYAKEFGIKID